MIHPSIYIVVISITYLTHYQQPHYSTLHLTLSLSLLLSDHMSSIDSYPSLLSGELYKHHSLRIAYFHQHQQDCLPFDSTPLQYMASLVGVSSLSLDNNNSNNNNDNNNNNNNNNTDASHSATNSSISTMTIITTTNTNNNGDSQWNEQKLRAHLGSFGISGNGIRIMNLSA